MKKIAYETQTSKLYQQVFEKIEEFEQTGQPIVIGIDGTAGSGKSYLAAQLAEKYDVQVFHMDDFFLPKELKTKERLNQPGGNVHYERFLQEVLEPLKQRRSVRYQPYDCQVSDYGEEFEMLPKQINLIEGVYCFHPLLESFYDWKVLLKVDSKTQEKRILQREGNDKLEIFLNRWIPLEKHYFQTFEIEKNVDVIIDTSDQ
ncbi:uridine kinase family protein [Amphibacillus sp. Q70]|uniref:uridine kinase family protein n=1 Tax=Amphibacillus sp. Q70 TaxID=3453416 RepID=UPI003F84F8D2